MEENPEVVLQAPHTTLVRRLDEGLAARNLELTWGSAGTR